MEASSQVTRARLPQVREGGHAQDDAFLNRTCRAAIADSVKTRRLDLSFLRLTSVPASVFKLKNLEELNLSNNAITHIPDGISNLLCLKRLDISCNSLVSITPRISSCTSLEYLNLSNNQLTTLPSSLCLLKKLRSVLAHGNNLNIPSYVTLQEMEGLRNYLTEQFEEESRLEKENKDTKYKEKEAQFQESVWRNKVKRLDRKYQRKHLDVVARKDGLLKEAELAEVC